MYAFVYLGCDDHFRRHHSSRDDAGSEIPSEAASMPQPIIIDNSDIKEELAAQTQRIEQLLSKNPEVDLLRSQVKAMRDAKELTISEIVSLQKELEIEQARSGEAKKLFDQHRESWAAEKVRLLAENDRLAKEKLEQAKTSADNSNEVEVTNQKMYTDEIARLEQRNRDLYARLEQEACDAATKIDDYEEKNAELKRRLDHSESLIERLERDHEQENKSKDAQHLDQEQKWRDQLTQLNQQFDIKEMKWEKQLQASAESETTIENERRSLEHIIDLLRDESSAKDVLRSQLEERYKKEIADLEKSWKDKLNDTEKNTSQEFDNLRKELSDKKRECEIYENEKLSLEKQMELINGELKKVKFGLEQKITESNKQAATLKELESKLADMRGELKSKSSSYDADIVSLQQEILLYKNKIDQEKLAASQLLAEKLELEAKLSLALDDLATAEDAATRKESEFERGRTEVLELRRKYDDTLAALLDLGRENQILQIEQAKLVGRNWQDDSQVTECTACAKQFSLTVRKVG